MPKTTNKGTAKQSELPETLRRSPAKAQRTFAKAHDNAVEQYGEGERAHRVAYAALKHTYERRGDRWEPKDQKGPSDPRSKSPRARYNEGKTYGGVDVEGNTKQELTERARSRHSRPLAHVQRGTGRGHRSQAVRMRRGQGGA